MKIKLLFAFLITGAFMLQSNAQTLNQNASWPNPSWTITGTYNTSASAFEADPTTSSNFAFDDDDAGSGSDDSIAAESPVIDLTAAQTAGETLLTISGDYVYRKVNVELLQFEFFDADASTWNLIPPTMATTTTSTNNNFCSGTPVAYTSNELDISGFTSTQLAGFRYRIFYDDDPLGAGYKWGFCFSSPTITSAAPATCPVPTTLEASNVTSNSADLTWAAGGTETEWEYALLLETDPAPTTGTTTSMMSFDATSLTDETDYTFYVRANCGPGDSSDFVSVPFSTPPLPPSNDECGAAIDLTVNADYNCGTVTNGTILGATNSGIGNSTCSGTEDDDVWYKFVAAGTGHRVSLTNFTGSTSDMYMVFYEGTAGCGMLGDAIFCSDPQTANLTGLTIGTTYYIQVYTWTSNANQTSTFDICIGTAPTCLAPTSANTNTVTDTSANLSWTENNGASTWNIEWGVDGFTQGAGTTITGTGDNPYALTGLTQNTAYDYYVQTDCGGGDLSAWTGPISFRTLATPPANDNCSGALPITASNGISCDNAVSGTTAGATPSASPECTGGRDVWYAFTAANDGDFSVGVTETFESSSFTSTYLSAYEGACGSLTRIGNTSCFSTSSISFTATMGTTYYFNVRSSSSTGYVDFDLCVYEILPPANDLCSTATPLTVGFAFEDNAIANQTNGGASDSGELPLPGCAVFDPADTSGNGGDVWYSAVVPASGKITFETARNPGSFSGDGGAAVYSGSCGALVLIECDDDSSTLPGAFEKIEIDDMTLAGQTVYLRVWELGGDAVITFQASAYTERTEYIWDGSAWNNIPEGNITANDNMIVQAGTMPSLTSAISVNNLTIESGASLEANNGDITVAGNVSNFGSITGSSQLVLTSSGSEVSGTGSLSNLTVESGVLVSITGPQSITQQLDIVSGGLLDSQGNLTLVSNASGTARIDEVDAGSISGEVNVERYIPAGNTAFRFVGTSVSGSTVFDSWQEAGSNAAGFGVQVTGTAGTVGTINATTGFDETISGAQSMFKWDSSTQTWIAVNTTRTEILIAGEFYRLYVRGDRVNDLSTNSPTSTATTLRSTGNLFQSALTVTPGIAAGEFFGVANPYQSKVSMATTATGTTADMYYWDPNIGPNGSYSAIAIGGSPSATGTVGLATNVLEAGQAVFFQDATGSASVTVSQSDKVVGNNNVAIFNSNNAQEALRLKLYQTSRFNNNQSESDGLLIEFDPAHNLNVDLNDAIKLNGSNANMSISKSTGELLAVERRTLPTATETINLNISNYLVNAYTMLATVDVLPGLTVYLKDNFNGNMTQLNQGTATPVNFIVDRNDPQSVNAARFEIVFEQVTLSSDSLSFGDELTVYPNPVSGDELYISIGSIIDGDIEVTLFNTLGQQVISRTFDSNSNGTISINKLSELKSGLYIVNISNGVNTVSKKIVLN